MDSEKPKKDWKVLERHYKLLSEVWSYHYEDQTRVSKAIMVMHGVLVEMHSEVIQFEKKHGRSEKLAKSYDRLEVLELQLKEISTVQDDYYRIKMHSKGVILENMQLREEISRLNKLAKEAENI